MLGKSLRFRVSLVNTVSNTSGARLLGGILDVVIAAPSAESFSILRAAPSPHVEGKAEGNTHALVKIPVLAAEQTFESRIDVEYTTAPLSFQLEQAFSSPGLVEPAYDYCRGDKFWETKDPLIRRTAGKIRHSSHDLADFLSNAFAWVRENVKLRDPQPTRLGAARAIRERTGDCDELSDIFIALCRTENVPCRRVIGLFYHGSEDERRPFEWHAWAEVQAAVNVWVPFDPSLNFFAATSERHLPRCCMGRRSDYPIRRLRWRSRPEKPPVLNDDDVGSINVVSS